VKQPSLRESTFINYIPAITQITSTATGTTFEPGAGISWMQVTIMVMVAGMLFMIVRLLMQYYSLFKMRSKAVLLYEDKVKLYHIDEPVMPFSFGRGIYVNQHQHSESELKEIIRHEFIHVKQRHSVDIIWSELLCILNWYNPFAWLLRHDIRQNLEFIADQQVLQTGLDRKQYQYLLLKVIGVNSFSIATNFNFSSLKKRIAMMNKSRSARVHLIRFLFLLPLLVVVLLAFRNTTQGLHQLRKETVTDTIPAAPKTPAGWKDIVTIDVTDELIATIRLKNGKTEKYDLKIIKQKEEFEKKYGPLPEPPTPPAPVFAGEKELPEAPEAPERPELPEAPEKIEGKERPELPEAPEAPGVLPVAPDAPKPPAAPEKITINFQDCLNKKGYCITIADNYGECVVIVKDKNSKIVEAVALTDWNKDKKYEEKYGEIPPRPAAIWKRTDGEKPVASIEANEVRINSPDEMLAVGGPVKVKTVAGSPVEVIANKITVAKTKAPELKIVNANELIVTQPVKAKNAINATVATKAKPVTKVDVTYKKMSVVSKKAVVNAKTATVLHNKPITIQKKMAVAVEKAAEKPKAPAEPQKQPAGQPEQEQ
jgi:hypothetical protein